MLDSDQAALLSHWHSGWKIILVLKARQVAVHCVVVAELYLKNTYFITFQKLLTNSLQFYTDTLKNREQLFKKSMPKQAFSRIQ